MKGAELVSTGLHGIQITDEGDDEETRVVEVSSQELSWFRVTLGSNQSMESANISCYIGGGEIMECRVAKRHPLDWRTS